MSASSSWARRSVCAQLGGGGRCRVTWPQFVHLLLTGPAHLYDSHWAPVSSHCLPCQLSYQMVLKAGHQSGKIQNYKHDFAVFNFCCKIISVLKISWLDNNCNICILRRHWLFDCISLLYFLPISNDRNNWFREIEFATNYCVKTVIIFSSSTLLRKKYINT